MVRKKYVVHDVWNYHKPTDKCLSTFLLDLCNN